MMRSFACAAFELLASVADAQSASARECPVVNGLLVSATTGDSARRSTPMVRLDGRTAIDTTWTFDVRDRTWSWPRFAASVGLGVTGGPATSAGRSAGMTTAPDSGAAAEWSVCAAASVGMRNSTLTLRGAKGTVRLRADVGQLTRVGGAARDTTRRPRR